MNDKNIIIHATCGIIHMIIMYSAFIRLLPLVWDFTSLYQLYTSDPSLLPEKNPSHLAPPPTESTEHLSPAGCSARRAWAPGDSDPSGAG